MGSSKNKDINIKYEYKAPEYQESDTTKKAQVALNQLQKPGAFQSNKTQMAEDALSKLLNRKEFSYDLNGDALYQQYKNQYMKQGNQAMQDTMGQATALTGGYGNSYAQTAGQQIYNQYLGQLNDKVPELYQLALDKYNQETNNLYNMYGVLADAEQRDYDKHRDNVSDYYTDYDLAFQNLWNNKNFDRSNYEYDTNFDYGIYADKTNFDYGQAVDNRNFGYQQERDAVDDERYATEWAQKMAEWNASEEQRALENQRYDTEWAHQVAQDNVSNNIALRELAMAEAEAKAKQDKATANANAQAKASNASKANLPEIKQQAQIIATTKGVVELETYLDALVDSGKITSQDADNLFDLYSETAMRKNSSLSNSYKNYNLNTSK